MGFFLGWVSWGSNLWRNPQYPHLWEQQRIWSRRPSPFRFKRVWFITGGWPIRGRGCCGRGQTSKTDSCEETYNAWWKRTWSANSVQGLIMWRLEAWKSDLMFVFFVESRMREMSLIIAIAWVLVISFHVFWHHSSTCKGQRWICNWSESHLEMEMFLFTWKAIMYILK